MEVIMSVKTFTAPKAKIPKRDCPIGDKLFQYFVLIANFLVILSLIGFVYFSQSLKVKELLPLGIGGFGLILFSTGIISSLAYSIMRYKKPNGGFGIFWWIGGFFITWGNLQS